MLSFEALLILGVIGFYLYDSMMLFHINELLLTKSYKGWLYKFPELDFQLLKKYPLLPNPLAPNVAIFRTSWPKDSQPIDKSKLDNFIQHLAPVQLVVNVLLLLLFIYIPVIALMYGSGSKLLIIFAMTYLFISVILFYIFNNKDELYISNSKFFSLVFESLACPPFALNMVRKISLNYPNLGDPISFSRNMFDSDCQKIFNKDVNSAINRNMKFLEVDSERYLELDSYLSRLKKG
jgi:hypothetical protein